MTICAINAEEKDNPLPGRLNILFKVSHANNDNDLFKDATNYTLENIYADGYEAKLHENFPASVMYKFGFLIWTSSYESYFTITGFSRSTGSLISYSDPKIKFSTKYDFSYAGLSGSYVYQSYLGGKFFLGTGIELGLAFKNIKSSYDFKSSQEQVNETVEDFSEESFFISPEIDIQYQLSSYSLGLFLKKNFDLGQIETEKEVDYGGQKFLVKNHKQITDLTGFEVGLILRLSPKFFTDVFG